MKEIIRFIIYSLICYVLLKIDGHQYSVAYGSISGAILGILNAILEQLQKNNELQKSDDI